MESSQAALNAVENSRDKAEDELDESMLEEKMKLERGEKLLNTSTDDISHDGKRSCVDSLATSLMLNVTVCSNYIFAHTKIDSRATSVVGSSHAGKLSALVSASLETKFLIIIMIYLQQLIYRAYILYKKYIIVALVLGRVYLL